MAHRQSWPCPVRGFSMSEVASSAQWAGPAGWCPGKGGHGARSPRWIGPSAPIGFSNAEDPPLGGRGEDDEGEGEVIDEVVVSVGPHMLVRDSFDSKSNLAGALPAARWARRDPHRTHVHRHGPTSVWSGSGLALLHRRRFRSRRSGARRDASDRRISGCAGGEPLRQLRRAVPPRRPAPASRPLGKTCASPTSPARATTRRSCGSP